MLAHDKHMLYDVESVTAARRQNILVQEAIHRIRKCHGFLGRESVEKSETYHQKVNPSTGTALWDSPFLRVCSCPALAKLESPIASLLTRGRNAT